MRPTWSFVRAAALAVGLVALSTGCSDGRAGTVARAGGPAAAPAAAVATRGSSTAPLPRLVDVGAGKCIPCKAMAPILEQLRADLAGRLDVQFVDVWVNPDAGQPYGIRMIPTQIFYAADGRELSRHEGFMSRDEILARWNSHGVAF